MTNGKSTYLGQQQTPRRSSISKPSFELLDHTSSSCRYTLRSPIRSSALGYLSLSALSSFGRALPLVFRAYLLSIPALSLYFKTPLRWSSLYLPLSSRLLSLDQFLHVEASCLPFRPTGSCIDHAHLIESLDHICTLEPQRRHLLALHLHSQFNLCNSGR